MEIIFCRCGGAEVIFGGSAPSIQHLFFQPVPHRNCGSAPVRGAEGGVKVPISDSVLLFCSLALCL